MSPLKLILERELDGGVKKGELLYDGRKMYVALVGTGKNASYPTHKIILQEATQDSMSSEVNFIPEIASIKSVAGV